MNSVFLESHNLRNPCSGFGQFNHHLIQAFAQTDTTDFKMTVHVDNPHKWKKIFGSKFNYKCYFSFRRYKAFRLEDKRYDLWHSLNQNTKIEPKSSKTPYLLTVHDTHFAGEGHQKRIDLFREKLNRASAITYISEYAREETHRYFDIHSIPEFVIYNGNPITEELDVTQFKSPLPLEKPYFYSIGNFLERKNFHSLIEMMCHLPDFNLIISGDCSRSYGSRIKDLIQKKRLQERVFLTGKVSELGKQFYLKNCAGFCWPSLREGFGLPPIEAMQFKKPVFLSSKTSLPEIGGDVAFYWDNFDPEDMKHILLEGLHKYETNIEVHHRALSERAEFFCWQKAAKQYLEVYRSLV